MRKLGIYLLLLTLGFFLFGCISTSTGSFDPVKNLNQWTPIAVIAIVISLMFVAIAYMLAELMRMPELNAWAKNELYENLISIFFLGIIVAVMIFLNVFVTAVAQLPGTPTTPLGTVGTEAPHFQLADAYLEDAETRILDTYTSLVLADQYIDALGTLTLSFPVNPVSVALRANIGFTPAAGLAMISNSLITISDTLAIMDVLLISQQTVLKFIEDTMFSIFLPLGIVLRAFPFTRRLGSTIIALSITLYVVYPLSLAMNRTVMNAVPPYDRFVRLSETAPPGSLPGITEPEDQLLYEGDTKTITWQSLGLSGVDDCQVTKDGAPMPASAIVCDKFNRRASVVVGPETLGSGPLSTSKNINIEVTFKGTDSTGNPDTEKDSLTVVLVPNCVTNKVGWNWFKCWYLSLPWVNGFSGVVPIKSFGGETMRTFVDKLLDPSSRWQLLLAPVTYNQQIFDWLVSVLPVFAQYAAFVTLFTAIDIVICVTFFRSLSVAIGGESQIIGLARVM